MNMDLPEQFQYFNNGNIEAYIENGILKIYNVRAFRRIVYDLTYILNGGKHYCLYCNKYINNNKATLDHKYPRAMGGPTITNNLICSCQKWNSEKSSLTYLEFITYIGIKERDENFAKIYFNDCISSKDKFYQNRKYQIPEDWLSLIDISNIKLYGLDGSYTVASHRYLSAEKFYLQYGYFKNPIVVDKNFGLLDEYYEVMYAKNNNISTMPGIMLKNVEIVTKEN